MSLQVTVLMKYYNTLTVTIEQNLMSDSIENYRKLNKHLRTVVYYRYQRLFNETKFKLPHILEGFVVE